MPPVIGALPGGHRPTLRLYGDNAHGTVADLERQRYVAHLAVQAQANDVIYLGAQHQRAAQPGEQAFRTAAQAAQLGTLDTALVSDLFKRPRRRLAMAVKQ
jgi:hypothetical protein